MKLNAEKIQEAAAWVERNGLHPQPCGATLRDFCKAMGITWDTYKKWCEKSEFSDALTRARELFRITTVREVENALVKAARGVDFTRIKEEAKADVVKEYDPKTGKKVKEYTGELKTVKATRETVYFPPNVEAAKFVLTNLAGDAWKIKQETALTGTILKVVVENTEQRKKIDNIADLG